jgi:hypothetical protein
MLQKYLECCLTSITDSINSKPVVAEQESVKQAVNLNQHFKMFEYHWNVDLT